jgi:hypothetical protein
MPAFDRISEGNESPTKFEAIFEMMFETKSPSFRDAPLLGRRPGIHTPGGGYGFRARAQRARAPE